MVCLICTPKAQGPQAQGLRVDISSRLQVPVCSDVTVKDKCVQMIVVIC